MSNTLHFVKRATEDFEQRHGHKPTTDEDWDEVHGCAQRMAHLQAAMLKTQPTAVPGWKFGCDEIEWNDA